MAIARTALEALIMSVVIVFLLTLRWFVIGDFVIGDFLSFMEACAYLCVMGLGVGLTVMSLSHFVPVLPLVFSYINRLLYFTSGVFFTLSAIPSNYRSLVDWSPILQAVELARVSYFTMLPGDLLNPGLLAVAVPGIAVLGFFAERATRDISKKVSTS